MSRKRLLLKYQIVISYTVSLKKRLTAMLLAVLIVASFPFIAKFYHFINYFVYNSIFSKLVDHSFFYGNTEALAELLVALTEHAVFGLLVYSIFTDLIERWLGHKIREVPRFNSTLFLSKIRKSDQSVIIHETFIRELIEDHADEFKYALEQFLTNCIRAHPQHLNGRIKVLVLHPMCEAIKSRYIELDQIDIKPVANFLVATQKWLVELQGIQKHINKIAAQHTNEKGDFFELKVGYEKPVFSLYYCDKYASISYYDKKPSVLAPQIVFLDANKSEAAKKQQAIFEQYWDKAVFLPIDFKVIDDTNAIVKFEDVIKIFKDITIETNGKKIKEKLEDLSKMCSKNHELAVELINHLESNHRKRQVNYVDISKSIHYNIFGTGGDNERYRSINISTIASILASHFRDPSLGITEIPVIKSGTLAVTCKVGSQQFYQALEAMLINNKDEYSHIDEKKMQYLDYNSENKSIYLPITYFGYIYREVVRRARNEMYSLNNTDANNGRKPIDIYKIIFPAANLTDYKAIINGVSRTEYIEFFEYIYVHKRKTGIIVHNKKGIDELFEGTNQLIYYQDGIRICDYNLHIRIPDNAGRNSYFSYFKESNGAEHVGKFFQLFDEHNKSITKEIRETISYNIALFIQLHFLVSKSYSPSDNSYQDDLGPDRLKALMKIVYSYFFDAET